MQICDNLTVSAAPSQLPWKGGQGGAHRRRFSELRDNLSVSLRLTAPLEGEPFLFHAFHGQADAAAFLVDVEDGDFDDVADGDDFGGVLDILAADLRDVDEAVLVDADVLISVLFILLPVLRTLHFCG